LGAIGLLALLAALILFGRREPHEPEPVAPSPEPTARPPAPPPEPSTHPPAPPPKPAAPAMPAQDARGAAAEALPPSHPITAAHERIQAENAFIQALNDAMDLRDGATLRKLAAQYRAKGFKDVDKLGEGYEIVANCLEHPGAASRAAAQAFFDRERGSNLRRHLHRHCLE
jgi:type IV secretory pathway VirB10-like protein